MTWTDNMDMDLRDDDSRLVFVATARLLTDSGVHRDLEDVAAELGIDLASLSDDQ